MDSCQRWIGVALSLLLGIAFLLAVRLHGAERQRQDEVKIGMMNSLFDEQDEKKIRAQIEPFAALVRRQTGTKGDFVVVPGLDRMIEDLKADRIQLGVMHGVEYAWLKGDLPAARPLLIAVGETTNLRAVLLVHQGSPAAGIEDLRDKTLALNNEPPFHVRFWLDRMTNGDHSRFFRVTRHKDVDAAMEEVADKAADATAVSEGALEYYKRQKRVRFQRFFKVLLESPPFPAPVMVYFPGQVRQDLVQRFHKSMLAAHESPEGRDTLQLWRLKRFLDVPPDYEALAEETARRYPRSPEAGQKP